MNSRSCLLNNLPFCLFVIFITPIGSPLAINGTHKRELTFNSCPLSINLGSFCPRFDIIDFFSTNTVPAIPSPTFIFEHSISPLLISVSRFLSASPYTTFVCSTFSAKLYNIKEPFSASIVSRALFKITLKRRFRSSIKFTAWEML